MAVDQEKTPEDNEKRIQHAINDVKTGQITYAVRDSMFNGVDIEEGNIIGIVENEIEAVGGDIADVIKKVIGLMVNEDSSLITLYYGDGIKLDDAEILANEISEKYMDCDVELHYGGQPLYYYILSVE